MRLGVVKTVVEVQVKPGMILVDDKNPTGFYYVNHRLRCYWIDTDGELNRCVEAGGSDALGRNWTGWRVIDPAILFESV